MAYTRKIKAGLVPIDPSNFVGEQGIIFYNTDTGSLFLSDGVTPGGIPLNATGITGGNGYTGSQGNIGYTGSAGLASPPIAVSGVDNFGNITNQIANITALRFNSDSGISVTDLGTGQVEISIITNLDIDGGNATAEYTADIDGGGA